MNNVKSFAKKFENEINVNALKINIKTSIIKVIKSSSKKQHVEINILMTKIKSFVKKFRDNVINEDEISNKNETSNENFVILIF